MALTKVGAIFLCVVKYIVKYTFISNNQIKKQKSVNCKVYFAKLTFLLFFLKIIW